MRNCKSVEPRSRGLPEGLLDQPFHGWGEVAQRNLLSPLQRAYLRPGFSRFDAKAIQLKRAHGFEFTLEPGAASAGLVTQRESRVNAANYGNGASSEQVLSEET